MSDIDMNLVIRAALFGWCDSWLQVPSETRAHTWYYYSHGDTPLVLDKLPQGKRLKVTFALEDDPNADLLQERPDANH